MHAEDDAWVCASCDHEAPRDGDAEATLTAGAGGRDDASRDDGAPAVTDATPSATETVEEPCPAEDCESEEATYEMRPKPGGSYEFRLFTCVECGHRWRDG